MNKEILKKRIEVLNKIDALTHKCNCQSAIEFKCCSNCKKIQKYGRKLLKLVNKRKKFAASINVKPVKSSKLPLTKARYFELKSNEKSDKEIAELFNVSSGTIKNWKRLNNIKTERLKGNKYKKNGSQKRSYAKECTV